MPSPWLLPVLLSGPLLGCPRAWAQALRPACVWVGDKVPVYTPSCKLPPCPVLHPCPAKMPLPLMPWSEAIKVAVVSCGLKGFLLWPWQKHPLWESEPRALQSPELGHRKRKGPVGPGVMVSGLGPALTPGPQAHGSQVGVCASACGLCSGDGTLAAPGLDAAVVRQPAASGVSDV